MALSHFWTNKTPTVVRSRCGGVESLVEYAKRHYVGPPCPACFNGTIRGEDPMLCAVPLGSLAPLTGFVLDVDGRLIAGAVERIPSNRGYVTVVYAEPGGGKRHEFKDRDGDPVEFTDGGFRRSEWSAGTLVRPLMEEEEMSEMSETLVEQPEVAVPAEVKAKVTNIKAKIAGKLTGKPKMVGKPKAGAAPAPKAKPAPKAAKAKAEPREQRPCLCGCGAQTGGKFAPGHDARVKGWLGRIAKGEMEFKELPKSLQKLLVDVKGVKKAMTRPIKTLGD